MSFFLKLCVLITQADTISDLLFEAQLASISVIMPKVFPVLSVERHLNLDCKEGNARAAFTWRLSSEDFAVNSEVLQSLFLKCCENIGKASLMDT